MSDESVHWLVEHMSQCSTSNHYFKKTVQNISRVNSSYRALEYVVRLMREQIKQILLFCQVYVMNSVVK